MNESIDEGRFRFCVAAVIENINSEKILLIKRTPDNPPPDIWDVVGGAVEQFEDPYQALFREIEEETGITDISIIKALNVFSNIPPKYGEHEMIGVTFWVKTTTREVKLSNEHLDYKWLKPLDALKLAEHPVIVSIIQKFIKEKSRVKS
ncbi:MAG: NUDIX domain-containing protein [Asgard group archaeon]|nr:NUDIX domain-containing protein [Asgard group archaeon]